LWLEEPNDNGPNDIQTGDKVRQFVTTCIVPAIHNTNHVDEGHMNVWDDASSCDHIILFAEIINDCWIEKIVKRHFVEDNENFPLIHGNKEFFEVSKKNLHSVHTAGNLAGSFKQLCCLTNAHMHPEDDCPVDNEHACLLQDNIHNGQDQVHVSRSLAAEMGQRETNNNNVNNNANNELTGNPIDDSEADKMAKEVARGRPRRRCRLNDD